MVIVLEDIHDPHNAGAILRSAEVFGIGAVYFIFEKEKPYNPKKVGKVSSASANKWLKIKIFHSTRAGFSALKRLGYRVFATSLTPDSSSIFATDFSKGKLAIVFGNEHRGLSEFALKHSQARLVIPVSGMVQSLNVSVAAGICIFEVTRQRKHIPVLLDKVPNSK